MKPARLQDRPFPGTRRGQEKEAARETQWRRDMDADMTAVVMNRAYVERTCLPRIRMPLGLLLAAFAPRGDTDVGEANGKGDNAMGWCMYQTINVLSTRKVEALVKSYSVNLFVLPPTSH
ncbi:hypothetical protein ElyMa_004925200 [Elysia marginata]|uniref:Uncharacterized protein n=1 Tax=Elysia marginata TaxID=1093978 RepID=A0AAV4IZP7_9GAST|nr:hypothetical protein ElyMa_004925200 [Elysia marginata]